MDRKLVLVGILISSLIGFSNFDAFAQTDIGVLTLDSFHSSAQVDDIITFTGTLNLENKNSEKPIVYIKNANLDGEDNLLIMTHVNNDGTFSVRWTVNQFDENNNLKIYAFYEGDKKLSKLTTCHDDQTRTWDSKCPQSQSFSITNSPAPTPYTTNELVGDEYIKLYYALDFFERPTVAIVPSSTSYDKVKSHITPVKEGLLMLEDMMTEKYGGNWKIKSEVFHPGDKFDPLEFDIIMNIVTEYEDEKCFNERGGAAWVWENVQKPIKTNVCSYNFGQKNPDNFVSTTTAHEFIHAIGVGHAFGIAGDLMCSSEEDTNGNKFDTCPQSPGPKAVTPTELNLAAVAELYSTDGFKGQNNIVEYKSKFSGKLDWDSFTFDRDRDNIFDWNDSCPSTAGYSSSNGCPFVMATITSDADHDGIPNEFDRCPTGAEVYNGFQDEDGCADYVESSTDESKEKQQTESEEIETVEIPDWIRTQAKWWSVGVDSNSDFSKKGVVYMIDDGLVHLESPIPDRKSIYFSNAPNWFKVYVEAWTDGEVTNKEFLEKIQILLDTGFLRVR